MPGRASISLVDQSLRHRPRFTSPDPFIRHAAAPDLACSTFHGGKMRWAVLRSAQTGDPPA
jgi:hypothetical protein